MKVLVQTNKRHQVHLEHEFKMIEHAGFIPVPYGYVESEPNVIFLKLSFYIISI